MGRFSLVGMFVSAYRTESDIYRRYHTPWYITERRRADNPRTEIEQVISHRSRSRADHICSRKFLYPTWSSPST